MTALCVQLPARDRDGPEADAEITRSLRDEEDVLIWLLIRWEVWSRRRAGGSVAAGGRRDDPGLMCAVERQYHSSVGAEPFPSANRRRCDVATQHCARCPTESATGCSCRRRRWDQRLFLWDELLNCSGYPLHLSGHKSFCHF